ncbi:MAG: glycosyltransferase [Candidatus Abyssobacteria bacterium SURF_5]|uniref:Glycosyltransferase n=1 Tax=Abyssobacteria bacterium (strain SURF_5) TaxID=2093360 RepID=A0A3A4NDA4_ABYX5|nr:MAG: glycosyltransferase [Candidatus Abyssubacteria bacterium SURF_5]
MNVATVIFFLFLFYIGFLFFGYRFLMRYLVRNRKIQRVQQEPPVTIVVPAFNEERNIARKIKDLRALVYPSEKLQIIIVDNASTDRTHSIASTYPVEVFQSPRGKVNAINTGIRQAASDIVVVTDADTLLKPDAIKSLVTCFSHDLIGAVGGKAIVEDTRSFFGRSKMKYHAADWELRTLEGRLDSCISLDGKLMAFRKGVLPALPPDVVVDDLEITFRLRSQGFRSVIDDQSIVYETGPQTLRAEIRQIRRRVALTIPVLFNYIHMLFNPRYGGFGLLIFPIRRMFAVFSPLIFLYVVSFVFWWDWKLAVAGGIISLPAIILTGQYFPLIQQMGIVLGWYDVLTARVRASAQWEKVN